MVRIYIVHKAVFWQALVSSFNVDRYSMSHAWYKTMPLNAVQESNHPKQYHSEQCTASGPPWTRHCTEECHDIYTCKHIYACLRSVSQRDATLQIAGKQINAQKLASPAPSTMINGNLGHVLMQGIREENAPAMLSYGRE